MNSDPDVFNDYSEYYDLLYRDKDYSGEALYIQKLLKNYGLKTGSLLEFGSGTGKHGNLLAAMGYSVVGIELSQRMVSQAIEAQGFTCQQGNICTVRLNRIFDAVLALFHVISYQTTNNELMQVFTRAAEHLTPGGLFIFDFWYSPAVYSQKPDSRIKRITNLDLEITRLAEPVIFSEENRVEVNYTIFGRNVAKNTVDIISETHSLRHFSLPEIDLLASATGFARINAEEFLSGRSVSSGTWGVCVVLKKND